MPRTAHPHTDPTTYTSFGALLRFLRHRARLKQRDLSIATGYSEAHISRLERNQRLPDLTTIAALFVPALGLETEPETVARLLELAAHARGEPLQGQSVSWTRQTQHTTTTEVGSLEHIPILPSNYVERAAQTRLIDQLHRERHVLVCGLAGVGKTVLAAAVARSLDMPVCWITLTRAVNTSVEALLRQLAVFAVSLGQQQVTSLLSQGIDGAPTPPLDQQMSLVAQALTQRSVLLCIDNVQLVAHDAAVIQMLRHIVDTTDVTVLLLGREQMLLPGWVTVTLGGLSSTEGKQMIGLLGHQLSGPLTTRLLAKTAGNPMLIRLALGQLADSDVAAETLIEDLEQTPQVAEYLLHTTLRHLSPAAYTLAELLSVWATPVDLYDEDLLDTLIAFEIEYDAALAASELSRHNLIDHPARAVLPPLIADHIYTTLAARLPYRRMLHHVVAVWLNQRGDAWVEAASHYAKARQTQAAIDQLLEHQRTITGRGDIWAAVATIDDLLRQTRRTDRAASRRQLLTLRGDLLTNTLRADEAEANYREALELAQQPAVRAHIAYHLATCLLQRGKASEVLALCRACSAALSPGETLLLSRLRAAESKALLMLSRFDEAEQTAQDALALTSHVAFSARWLDEVQAHAHGTLGIVAQVRRQFDAALDHFQRSSAAAERANLLRLHGRALANIGNVLFEQGQFARSIPQCNHALEHLRAVGDHYAAARVSHTLAMIHYLRADWTAALDLCAESLHLKQGLGDVQGVANTHNLRAMIGLATGQIDSAHEAIDLALTQARQTGEMRSLAMYLDTLALVQLLHGDGAAANHRLSEALTLPGATDDPGLACMLYNHQALVQLTLGHVARAQQMVAEHTPPAGRSEAGFDHQIVQAMLALAQADLRQAHSVAARLAHAAAEAEYTLYQRMAERVLALDQVPALCDLPYLLWPGDVQAVSIQAVATVSR